MNKKEIAEIKKNFSDDCGFFTVGKVLTAYIDAEKNIVYKDTQLYNIMPSDEAELIMINLKKTLSGIFASMLFLKTSTQRTAHRLFCTNYWTVSCLTMS